VNIHLMPWDNDDRAFSFRDITDTLLSSADVAYVVAKDAEPCDHSGETDVVCCGREYILRATFGPVVVNFGNGQLRDIDVAPSAKRARSAVMDSVSALVHLDGWTEILGNYVPEPTDQVRKQWLEAQERARAEKAAMSEIMAKMANPEALRELGIGLLKQAGDLEGAAQASTGERIGQYV